MRTSVKLIWQNVQKSSQQRITRTLHVHYTYITRTLYVTKTRRAGQFIKMYPRYFLDILVVNSHQLINKFADFSFYQWNYTQR